MSEKLTQQEKDALLELARHALTTAVYGRTGPRPELSELPEKLRQDGVTFVTLTGPGGLLRGCVGAMEAYQPLALDVYEHAIAAGLHDYRFAPLRPEELQDIRIEISRLTPPQRLQYSDENDLLAKLRPGVDGVLMKDGFRQATFLPQVWEKIPDPVEFLAHLCTKMGLNADYWRYGRPDVYTYEVEEFQEGE